MRSSFEKGFGHLAVESYEGTLCNKIGNLIPACIEQRLDTIFLSATHVCRASSWHIGVV